ncbi:hypothetical protein AQI88_06260 [Streptomyces cellostaticus]|uniref:Chaplin domain-containing protein n=1 Tax=Streptomyces cellostaticus TaxID=67285 RepID=A0A117PXJ9_9ACTN|nr:hypothetical protein [Streptomyces cellostaticus]KUM97535.1 hypothetical protein AQI88_06260 [Streptomyces cellostaticus]GHI08209.1 hypothetical protein Scel_65300 [Streptomyces cellostaticus]
MKKISALAALTMAGLALATPAHADNGRDPLGHFRVAGANFTGATLCKGAFALVPVAAPWTGNSMNDACDNRPHTHNAPSGSEQPGSVSDEQ